MDSVKAYNQKQIEAMGTDLTCNTTIRFANLLRCEIGGEFLNTEEIINSLEDSDKKLLCNKHNRSIS